MPKIMLLRLGLVLPVSALLLSEEVAEVDVVSSAVVEVVDVVDVWFSSESRVASIWERFPAPYDPMPLMDMVISFAVPPATCQAANSTKQSPCHSLAGNGAAGRVTQLSQIHFCDNGCRIFRRRKFMPDKTVPRCARRPARITRTDAAGKERSRQFGNGQALGGMY